MFLCSQECIYIATSTSTKHQMKLKLEEYKAETDSDSQPWDKNSCVNIMCSAVC